MFFSTLLPIPFEEGTFTSVFQTHNIYTFVSCLGIFGGYLLGVRTSSGLSFYDWETLDLVRRIEVQPR